MVKSGAIKCATQTAKIVKKLLFDYSNYLCASAQVVHRRESENRRLTSNIQTHKTGSAIAVQVHRTASGSPG